MARRTGRFPQLLHQAALCGKLENRRDRRVGAPVAAAPIGDPCRETVAVNVHSADSAEGATFRQLWPVPDERIWIDTIIHRRSVLCGATRGDEQHGAMIGSSGTLSIMVRVIVATQAGGTMMQMPERVVQQELEGDGPRHGTTRR